MYYDRRPEDALVHLLAPGQPLAWMVDLVRTSWGDQALAHIQFRRARGARSRGAIQFYLGRTCPLEVRLRGDGTFELLADPFYERLTSGVFGLRFDDFQLPALTSILRSHMVMAEAALRSAPAKRRRAFLNGEAVAHAGFMRRYGHGHRPGDLFHAIDSEVRVGFDSIAKRKDFEKTLRDRLSLSDADKVPSKLDTLGVFTAGDAAVIEVKDEAGDVAGAAIQVASHIHTLRELLQHQTTSLATVLTGMGQMKHAVGLGGQVQTPAGVVALVPIIASPDRRPHWFDEWEAETRAVRAAQPNLLADLRFWRLSRTGEILEERTP